MKFLTIILILAFGAGCQNLAVKNTESSYENVLSYCLEEISKRTGAPLSPKADQAYLQYDKKGYFVAFTHGALGTFGKRSLDYSLVMGCAVVTEPKMKLVYLGQPMKDTLVEEPEMNQLETNPEGSTEILFIREDGKFKYCCSQPFDEKNIEKHNPNFPWNGKVE